MTKPQPNSKDSYKKQKQIPKYFINKKQSIKYSEMKCSKKATLLPISNYLVILASLVQMISNHSKWISNNILNCSILVRNLILVSKTKKYSAELFLFKQSIHNLQMKTNNQNFKKINQRLNKKTNTISYVKKLRKSPIKS